jgi:hypothetical protein
MRKFEMTIRVNEQPRDVVVMHPDVRLEGWQLATRRYEALHAPICEAMAGARAILHDARRPVQAVA